MFLSVSATWCVSEKSRWTIPSQKQMMLTLHELAKRSETEPETKDTHCYLIKTDRTIQHGAANIPQRLWSLAYMLCCCLAVSFLVMFSPRALMLTGYFLCSGLPL